VIAAIAAGAVTLFPSLWILFRLLLKGRFDEPLHESLTGRGSVEIVSASTRGLLGRVAIACLILGVGTLNGVNASWAHIIGVFSLIACIVLGVLAVAPTQLAASSADEREAG